MDFFREVINLNLINYTQYKSSEINKKNNLYTSVATMTN